MVTVVNRGSDGRNMGHNLTGQRFHSLTVLQQTGERDINGYMIWKAQCDCGNIVERPSYRFMRGMKTCGCGRTGRLPIPNSGAHVNMLYGKYCKSARERNHLFLLTKQEFRTLIEAPCHYCGLIPQAMTRRNIVGEYASSGIDRINNAGPYEVGNCVPCCMQCNYAKHTQTLDDFKVWVKRVADHLHL